MPPSTILITGASSGLGLHIALACLSAGHTVIATARNPTLARQQHPSIKTWLPLDVTSPDTTSLAAAMVAEHDVNVVINNAGYALRGVCEDLSLEEYRAQMETNLFGAIAVTKAVLPHLRTHHPNNATIVNISSTSGLTGSAGYTAYAASKFALEGFSESLCVELKDVGIRVLLVEPGAFRTNFQSAATGPPVEGMNEAYQGTAAAAVIRDRSAQHGRQEGDPVKAGKAIVRAVMLVGEERKTEGLLRLPLGRGAVARTEAKIRGLSENLEVAREIAGSVCFDGVE